MLYEVITPDVLLLDEPTNHLDVESIVWLEGWLVNEFKGALLMTCHDREFMNRVVGRIVEVANQNVTTYSRITSYNVCYTKLLRAKQLSLQV